MNFFFKRSLWPFELRFFLKSVIFTENGSWFLRNIVTMERDKDMRSSPLERQLNLEKTGRTKFLIFVPKNLKKSQKILKYFLYNF